MRGRFTLFLVVAGLLAAKGSALERSFRVTLQIVDDEQRPVAGAKAGVSYETSVSKKAPQGIASSEGLANEAGVIVLEGKTADGGLSYGASKQGYYPAYGLRYHFVDAEWGHWQPWDPTIKVLLKRIRNPVPMYAKRVHGEVPAKGVDVGYDLVVGDWVAPYGKGKTTDMGFHGEGEWKDNRNYRGKLIVTFPGQSNGLIPFEVAQSELSPLRMPYMAPAEGYETQRIWRSVRRYNPQTMENEEYINDSSKTQNFFFRVRSELDAEGKIVKAMYGKIHAPFEFGPRGKDGTPAIYFLYYLNPDGTRNIEYDPKRNLLRSAKPHDPDYENLAP